MPQAAGKKLRLWPDLKMNLTNWKHFCLCFSEVYELQLHAFPFSPLWRKFLDKTGSTIWKLHRVCSWCDRGGPASIQKWLQDTRLHTGICFHGIALVVSSVFLSVTSVHPCSWSHNRCRLLSDLCTAFFRVLISDYHPLKPSEFDSGCTFEILHVFHSCDQLAPWGC